MERKYQFGVTRISIMPVRREPQHKAEQITQLLFGEHYEVIGGPTGEWLQIRNYFDDVIGWISLQQHHEVSAEYIDYLNRTELKIATDLTAKFLFSKVPGIIVMGSILPISSTELFRLDEQFAFNGEAKNLGQRREAAYLEVIGRKYLNTPYQWGGKSPFGIDSAGLIQMIFRIAGYALRRDLDHMARQGTEVSFEESRVGDLAFFTTTDQSISHAGLVLSEHRILHAYGWVRIDRLTPEGILHPESGVLTHSLTGIRRIVPE